MSWVHDKRAAHARATLRHPVCRAPTLGTDRHSPGIRTKSPPSCLRRSLCLSAVQDFLKSLVRTPDAAACCAAAKSFSGVPLPDKSSPALEAVAGRLGRLGLRPGTLARPVGMLEARNARLLGRAPGRLDARKLGLLDRAGGMLERTARR